MLTKKDIEDFYKHVDSLGLKFPGAAIRAATKYSKGQISEILNRGQDPSENFLKLFYEKFPKGSEGEEWKRVVIDRLSKAIETMTVYTDKIIDRNLQLQAVVINSGLFGVAALDDVEEPKGSDQEDLKPTSDNTRRKKKRGGT